MMWLRKCIYWVSLCASSCVVMMNLMVLSRHEFESPDVMKSRRIVSQQAFRGEEEEEVVAGAETTTGKNQAPHSWEQADEESFRPVLHLTASKWEAERMPPTSPPAQPQVPVAHNPAFVVSSAQKALSGHRRSRTLIGIITSDTRNDCAYRKRHRELFEIWKDPRVCSLPELRRREGTPRANDCQLVYTFVIGAGREPDSPTQIVNASVPLYRDTPLQSKFQDVNDEDVTLLNIQENMNEGKSPTFFYFASTILEEHGLDYAMKLDGDSILHLHDWFLFAHAHLPPRPYARGVFAGALRHKAFWPAPTNASDHLRLESHWHHEYGGVHLYLAGQCYLMSLDLCGVVAREAPLAATKGGTGGYLEGHEDHDVSGMVFHSPRPIHMVTIGKSQRFWEHPVKGQPRWERIRKREIARVQGDVFEGKHLRLYTDP